MLIHEVISEFQVISQHEFLSVSADHIIFGLIDFYGLGFKKRKKEKKVQKKKKDCFKKIHLKYLLHRVQRGGVLNVVSLACQLSVSSQ